MFHLFRPARVAEVRYFRLRCTSINESLPGILMSSGIKKQRLVDHNFVVLNSGGFSRQFFSFINHLPTFSQHPLRLFTLEQLSSLNLDEKSDLDVIIVADHGYTGFSEQVFQAGIKKCSRYGEFLVHQVPEPLPRSTHSDVITTAKTPQTVGIHLLANAGYRKQYHIVVNAVKAAGYQCVIFTEQRLHDALEQQGLVVELSGQFDLYRYLPNCDLFIGDNNLLCSPMQQLKQLSVPALFIPHGFVGFLERHIDSQPPIEQVKQNVATTILQCFSHMLLPYRSLVPFYQHLFQDTPDAQQFTWIPGGYLSLDLAINKIPTRASRNDAILYCPGAIPKTGNIHDEHPNSFPTASEGIIDALLNHFPDFKVIFRPHPAAKDVPELNQSIQHIIERFRYNPAFIYDDSPTHSESFSRAALMVSDSSTSAFTYALAWLKPVLFYFTRPVPQSIEAEGQTYSSIRTNIGTTVINSIPELIAQAKQHLTSGHHKIPSDEQSSIKSWRDETFYQVNNTEHYLTDAITALVNRKALPDWFPMSSPDTKSVSCAKNRNY